MAMTAMGPLSLTILVPAVPRLAVALATTPETIQLMISLFLVGFATSQLALGPLSDRFGRRPVALAGLALTAAASLAALVASSIESLIAARVLQALGASTGAVIGRAVIRDLFARDRAASMLGLVTTAMVVAPMVSPLIGGLIDTLLGWKAIFGFIALVGIGVLVWAILALPETHREQPGHAGRINLMMEVKGLATSASFAGYVLASALGSLPFFTFVGGGPHVVISMMGRTSAEYGVWFALSAFGYMSGNFAASRYSVRYGIDAMIWAGLAVELLGGAIGVAVIAIFPDGGPALVFLPQVLLSFGNGVLLPNAIAGAISVQPYAAGAASGITGFVQMGMGAAGAQAVGHLLVGASSAIPMAWMILAAVVAGTIAFGVLVRR